MKRSERVDLLERFQGLLIEGERGEDTLGDMLKTEEGVRFLLGKDKRTPVLVGTEGGKPVGVDLSESTGFVINGSSGTGKSWELYSILMNLVVLNEPKDVNIYIFDMKKHTLLKEITDLPHVVGYETEPLYYIRELREVEEERKRRMDIIYKEGFENLQEYKDYLKEEGKQGELRNYPEIYIVIDEMTATMDELVGYDKLHSEFVRLISGLAQKGRPASIKLIVVGQRTTNDSIPKAVIANASERYGMKTYEEADNQGMFGKVGEGLKMNKLNVGEGYLIAEGKEELRRVKGLRLGLTNKDILNSIRNVAKEWNKDIKGKRGEGYGKNK